jgi:hypothetical protein
MNSLRSVYYFFVLFNSIIIYTERSEFCKFWLDEQREFSHKIYKRMWSIVIGITFVVILLLLFKCREFFININESIDYYDFGNNGPRICFIAGVHGNEPAGSVLLGQLLQNGYFKKMAVDCQIRVIPWVNKSGLKNNMRYQHNLLYPDINRNFTEDGAEPVSKQILLLLADQDLVVDFHEGWGYHLINPLSVGSTVSPTPDIIPLGELIAIELNKKINNPLKKFIVRKRVCEISSALECAMSTRKKKYILVETTGQNDVQPLDLRTDQVFTVIKTVLNEKHFYI